MLVVKIEIWPGDYKQGKHLLAEAHIGNVDGLADTSDYAICASEGRNPVAGTPACLGRGRIDGHERQQSV